MENLTGLLVSLMFVTLLTIGFGNILGAIAPRLKTPEDFGKHPLQTAWWAILTLVTLDTFWRCTAIFDIETWSFAEFLYTISGAILLFFASTALPSEEMPDKNPVFFMTLSAFHIWVLGLTLIFGGANAAGVIITALMAALPAWVLIQPGLASYKPATAGMACLTFLSLFL